MRPIMLAAGLAVGFLAGWVVFGTTEAPAPAGSRERAAVRAAGDPSPGPSPASPDAPPPESDAAAVIRDGSLEKLWPILNETGREFTDAEVAALTDRLDRAWKERRRQDFRAALHGLGRAGTDPAQRKLLDVLADESIVLPPASGDAFREGLTDCGLPGIATAARRRFEGRLAAGETSWIAASGYLDLVATHGSDRDLDWVFERRESDQIHDQALEALATSANPRAVERFAAEVASGHLGWQALELLARHRPAAAFPLIERELEREDRPRHPGASRILRLYGSTVPEEDLARAKAFLLGRTDPLERLVTPYAIQALHRRGLDTAGLESLILEVVVLLESANAETNRSLLSQARYVIESNRVTWSERAALALEAAARNLPANSMTADMVEIAKKVRAGLSSPWVDD